MKKAKFQIKGMHCQSCAASIEEKLKKLKGVLEAKVNLDSKKVVVVYEEDRISENEIKKTIEKGGDYQIEENMKKENSHNFYVPISIVVAGLIIAGAIIFTNRNQNPSPNLPTAASQPKPTLATATSQPKPTAAPAEFKITKDDHVRGNFEAPITLVEFSDFECPFCERHYPTMNKILADYKGKVRLVYKHFPLSQIHPNAQKAAEASECAAEQGKFWEYHDKLFENQASGLSLEKFKQWAKDLGLNSSKFNNCLDSGKYAQKVQADYQEGAEKGVNGTPATFVNGQLVSGAVPYESFKQIIDSLLK
jgi:protein-disulfide isomerase/copper chaperone CopZ